MRYLGGIEVKLSWSEANGIYVHSKTKFGISLVDQVTKGPWGIVFASTRIDRGKKLGASATWKSQEQEGVVVI